MECYTDSFHSPRYLSVGFDPRMSTPFPKLPTAPISVTNVDTWIALSAQESAQCEEAWQALSEERRRTAGPSSGGSSQLGPLEELAEERPTIGATISEDRLFEVDVNQWRRVIS